MGRRRTKLFVVSPHPQHFYCVLGFVDLVDEAVLDVDAPGIGAGEIANEPFIGRGILEWIGAQNRQKGVHAAAKAGGLDLLCVLEGVLRKDQLPGYHGSFFEHLAMGVFIFLVRDSRIPGTDRR